MSLPSMGNWDLSNFGMKQIAQRIYFFVAVMTTLMFDYKKLTKHECLSQSEKNISDSSKGKSEK